MSFTIPAANLCLQNRASHAHCNVACRIHVYNTVRMTEMEIKNGGDILTINAPVV